MQTCYTNFALSGGSCELRTTRREMVQFRLWILTIWKCHLITLGLDFHICEIKGLARRYLTPMQCVTSWEMMSQIGGWGVIYRTPVKIPVSQWFSKDRL